MGRAWIFQSNPSHYDVDVALQALDRIWWRVPQHTAEVHAGDVVVVWRSGKEAGIVGVGRVIADPRLSPMDPSELAFVRGGGEDVLDTTRALVRLRPAPFVSKDAVRALPSLGEHQIVTAPMGTVFPLTDDQWGALSALVPGPPDAVPSALGPLPAVWAWGQRAKGVLPMPGGYAGYLGSLESVCRVVTEERPTLRELPQRLEDVLGVKATAARLRASFLRKIGIIMASDGLCELSDWADRWLTTRDARIVAALLHSRCQFIGEMLVSAIEPRSTDDLLAVANERYGMGWDTPAQVSNRRGWLQSCGMLDAVGDGSVQASQAGRALLAELVLHEPGDLTHQVEVVADLPVQPAPTDVTDHDDMGAADDRLGPTRVQSIIDEMRDAATDSTDPDRLERAVRDAFAFLGYRAEWFGGSGKTDVLLDALLGRDDSYRVIIDCKSTGSGSLSDQQIDWVTLGEHKAKHDAQYVAIVGPRPSGSRLFNRALQHNVAVISVERLVGLCSQHAKTPLSLDDYRALFADGGEPDTQALDERSEDVARMMRLAIAACAAVRDRSNTFGRLTARDLYLILASDPAAEGSSQDELQGILDVLASPLFEVLVGDPASGYRATTSPVVAAWRIAAVGRALADSSPPEA